jgi:hypothetical protein
MGRAYRAVAALIDAFDDATGGTSVCWNFI